MERFYLWREIKHCSNQGTIETLVICYNTCLLATDNVYHDIEQSLKSGDNLPDCVCIIGNSNQYSVYEDVWKSRDDQQKTMLMRGSKHGLDFVKQYIFWSWSDTGFIKNILGNSVENYTVDLASILSRGVFSLLEKNNALHKAPSGHQFRHPSGNKNKLFIQARDLASDEAELFVVSYMIANAYALELREVKKIYIDTMGIYAYVKNALVLCGGEAEIISFHSYEELRRLNPPNIPYLCIISASTSGRMAKTLSERNFENNRISTIIDIKSVGRNCNVMVSLDAMGESFPDLAYGDGTLIEIIGENFTTKSKPPRLVVIGLPDEPPSLKEFHKYFGFHVNKINSSVEGNPKLLRLNALPVLDNQDFNDWLDLEINWSFPLTISHIIYANDETSRRLAEDIQNKLQSRLANGNSIILINYKDLVESVCKEATGVVVVSAVSRDGGVLREVSRDLRLYINSAIPRHFVTPIGIPQTSAAWRQLEIFLTKNPTSRSYGFSNWINMPIGGNARDNTWTILANLGAFAQDAMVSDDFDLDGFDVDVQIATESLDHAAAKISDAYNGFLSSSRDESLKLSEGFLFFAIESEIARRYTEVSHSSLYMTMSSVLQCAREHKDFNRKLCPNGYESVVLGPECFMRFNDSILQACILRACLPSELDYSSSPELSKLMREFLSKIFFRKGCDFGDAALEFAAAIAVGSLRLTHNDMEKLLRDFLENQTEPSALFGLLILARRKRN